MSVIGVEWHVLKAAHGKYSIATSFHICIESTLAVGPNDWPCLYIKTSLNPMLYHLGFGTSCIKTERYGVLLR